MNSPETEKESESAPTFEMRNTQRQNKKIKKYAYVSNQKHTINPF